jgi:hypothetical protein
MVFLAAMPFAWAAAKAIRFPLKNVLSRAILRLCFKVFAYQIG